MNFPFLKPTAWITCICFTLSVLAPSVVQAQAVAPTPVLSTPVAGTTVPSPGQMIGFSQPYTPAMITGVKVHPENPFAFDFIVDSGDSQAQEAELREEIDKLVQYFFTSLTVPEDQMWVNLSPHEKDRIMADHLSHTAMGRELLAQDYLLKQITATAFYPEEELGARFWERIRERAQSEYNITDIPTDTFNKVWIVPQKATVYVSENTAYITESRLKVMLEEDYLGVVSHQSSVISANKPLTTDNWKLMTTLIKEVILPALEAEVNTGANFAPLRQAVNSMILATWYKKNLKESILAKKYVDQNIVTGVDLKDQDAKEKIYQLYIEAFNKGVYDYIREEYDPSKQEIIPKKYFSGGIVGELAQVTEETTQIPSNFNTDNAMLVSVVAQTSDPALNTAIRQATDQAMSKENGEDSRDLTRIESEKKSTEVNSADTNYLSLPPQHLTTIKAFSVLVLSFIALYDVNLMSLPSETLKSFLVKMGILAVIVSVVMRKLRSRVVEQQLESREEEELKKDLSTEKLTGGENDQALLNDGRDDQIQIDPRDERLLDLEERQQWLELKQMRKGVFMAITFVSFLMAAVLGWINAKSAFVLLIVMCLVFLHMADDGTIEQIVEVKKEKKKLTKSEQGASRTLTSGQEDQPDNALLVWDREVKALSVQDQVTALASEVEYLRGTLQKEEKVLKQREYELDRMRERVAHVRNFEFIDNELLREFVRQPLILLCIVFALWGLQLGGFIADGSVLEKIYYGLLVYFPFFYPALLADRERAHRIYAAQVSKILKLEAEVREKETQLKRITEDSTRLAAPEEIDRAMSASRPEDSNPNGEINVTLQNNFGKAAKRTALEKETRDLSTEISLMQEEYDVLNERVVKLGKLLEGGVFIHIFGVFAIMQVFLVIGITFQFGLGIFDSFLNFLLVEVSSLIFSPIVTFWQRKSWEKEIKEKKKDMDKLQQKLQQNKHKLIGIKGRLGLPSAIEGEESRISAEEDVADHAMGTLRDVRDEVERLWNARHRLEKYIEELNGRSLLSILKRWKFSLMFPVTAAGFFFLDRTLINPISLGVAAAVVIAIDFFVFKKRQSVLRDLIREERKKIRKLNEAIDEAGWGTSSRIRDDNQTDRAMLAQSAVERPVSILSSSIAEIQQSVDRLKYLLFQWEELSYFILSPGDFSSTAMTLAGLRLATSPFYTVWRSFAIQQEQARLIESLRSEMRWLQDLINTHKGALSAEDLYKIRIISIRARHAFQANNFFQMPSTKFQMAKLALVSGDAAMSSWTPDESLAEQQKRRVKEIIQNAEEGLERLNLQISKSTKNKKKVIIFSSGVVTILAMIISSFLWRIGLGFVLGLGSGIIFALTMFFLNHFLGFQEREVGKRLRHIISYKEDIERAELPEDIDQLYHTIISSLDALLLGYLEVDKYQNVLLPEQPDWAMSGENANVPNTLKGDRLPEEVGDQAMTVDLPEVSSTEVMLARSNLEDSQEQLKDLRAQLRTAKIKAHGLAAAAAIAALATLWFGPPEVTFISLTAAIFSFLLVYFHSNYIANERVRLRDSIEEAEKSIAAQSKRLQISANQESSDASVSGDAAMSAGESKVEKFLLTEELQSLEEEIKSLEKETEGGVAYFKSFVLTVTMLALPLMALYLFPGVLSKIVVGIYIVIFIFAIEKMISGISALLNLFKPFNVSIRQRIDIEREIQKKRERVLEIEEKLRTLERGRLPEEDGDAAMTGDELQPSDQEALRRTIDELQIYKLYGKSDLDKVEKLITFLEKISRMKFVLGVTAIILTSLFLVVGIVSLSAPFVAVKILMPIGILIAMAIMVVQMVVPYDILKQKKEQKALIQQDLARIEKELTAVQALLDAAGELKRIEPGDQAMSAQEDDLPKGLVSTSSPDDLEQMYRQEETPSALIKKRVDNQRKALEVEEKNMDFFMNIESDLHITLVISFLLGAGLPGFWMVLDLLGLLSIPWYEIAFWKVILIPGAIMFFVSQQMRRIAATHLIHDQPKHVKKAQLKLKIAEAELDGNLSEFIRDAITGVHDELVAIGSEVDQGEYFRSYGILNISDLKESIESDPWAYYQEKSKVGRWRRIKDLYKKDQLAIKARDHARIMADFGLNYYNDDHFRLWLFNYGFKDLSLLDFASPEQIQNLVNLYNEIIYHSARASDVDYRVVNDEEEMNRFIQSKVVFLEREGEYLSGEYVKERDVKTVLLFRGNRIIGYVLLTLSEADSSQEVNVHKIFISPEYEAEQSEVILKAQMTLLGQSVSGEDGDQRSVVSDQADVPGTLKGDRLPEGDGDQAMTAREGKPGTDVMRPSVLELEQEMREKEKIPMMSEYNDLIKYLFRIFKKFELNILKRILDPKEMTRFFNFLYVNGFSMGGAPASYVTIAILMLTFTGGFTGLGLSLNLISFLIFVTAFFPLLIGLSILIGTIDARNIQQLLYKKGRSFKKLTLGLEIRRAIKYGAVIEYVGSIVKKLNFGLQEQEDDSDWELYYGVHRLASLWALRTNNDDPRSYYQAKATTAGRLRHRWNIIRGHWNEVRAKENAQIMLKFMDLYEDDAFRFWLFEYGLEDLELIEKTSPQDIEDLMYLYSMTGSEASVADEGKINFRRLGQDDLDSVIRLTRVMFSQNKRPDESRFSEEDKVTVGLFADDLLIGYVVFEQEGDTLKDKETFIAPVSNITIDDAIKQAIFAVLESKALPANVPGALKGDRLPEEVSDQAMGSWNSEEDPFQRMERQKEEVGEIIEAVKEYLKRQNDIEKNKDQIYNAVFYPTLFAALLVVVFSGKFLYALINVSMSFILGTVTLFPLAYVLYLVHKKKMDYPRRIISFEDDINEATSPQEVAQIHHIVTSSFDAFKERYDLFVEYEEFDQALSAIPPENQEDGEISPNPRSRFGGVEADQAMLGLPVEVLTDPNVLGGVAIALAAAGKWIKSKRGRLHLSAELNLENQVAKGRKAREIVTLSGEKFWEPRLSKETVRLILKKKLSPVERQQRDDQVKKFILQKVRFGDLILQGKLATPREKDRFLNERLKEGSFNSFGKDLIEDADVAKAMAALKSKGDFTTMLSVTYNGSYDVYSLDIIPTDLYENPPYMNRYQYGYTYEDDRIVFSDGYPEGFRIDFSRTDDSFTLMTGWDLKFKIRKTSSGTLIESGRGELNIDAGDIVGIVPSSLNATENRIVVIFKDSVDLNAIKLHDPSNSEFRVEFIHESSVEQYLDASGYELLSRLQVLEWSRERRAKHLDDYLFSVIKSATDAQKQRLKERIIKQIRHKIATGLYTYIHYGDRKASVSYWVEERLKKDIDRKSFVTGEDILSAIAYLIRDGDFQVVIYGSTNELKGEWATLRIKSVNTSPEQFDSDRPPLIPEGFNFVEYFDLALTAEQAAPGGIDLNPQNLELRQEGEEIHFDLPEAFRPFADVPINRLTPVIINITPIPSVPLLLGLEGFALDGGLTRENTHSPSPNIYHVWLRRNCPFKVQTRNEVKFFLPVGRQGA